MKDFEDELGDALKLNVFGYNSAISEDVFQVLSLIAERFHFVDEISEKLNLDPKYVELIQYLLCNANICDYGTSPRGCFIVKFDIFVKLKELRETCLKDEI